MKELINKKLLYPIKLYQELPPFCSSHNNMYNPDYYRCFAIDYKKLEIDYFSKKLGWYIRFKPFAIPKIRNNILKYVFGTRMYYIRTEHDKDFITFSEDLTKKEAKERIESEKWDEAKRDIYYSHIEYNGFLFKSKKEEKSKQSMFSAFLSIYT